MHGSKDWLFLVSKFSDASLLQPLPQNARSLDRKCLTVDKIASLIKKQLDPESRKRFARVKYLVDARAFLVFMENARTYALLISDLSEADSSKVVKWSISKDRSYIKVLQESGNTFEIPWDDVLFHCEPKYEFYKGKGREDTGASANQIGEKVRQTREIKGYSVQVLADKAKMKRPNLSRLEHGHHQPSLGTLEKIAKALEVSVAELITKQPRTTSRHS